MDPPSETAGQRHGDKFRRECRADKEGQAQHADVPAVCVLRDIRYGPRLSFLSVVVRQRLTKSTLLCLLVRKVDSRIHTDPSPAFHSIPARQCNVLVCRLVVFNFRKPSSSARDHPRSGFTANSPRSEPRTSPRPGAISSSLEMKTFRCVRKRCVHNIKRTRYIAPT